MERSSNAGAERGADLASHPEHLVVGHLSKVHGTKGELFVWPLTERPDEVFAEGRTLLLGDGSGTLMPGEAPLIVERSRPFKRGMLVKFEGFSDRDAVLHLPDRYLLVPFSELEPLADGEVFYHQLLGLEVFTAEGERVGVVREVYETEPSHLLEIKGEGKLHLVPFAEQIVRRIDLEAGRIVIKPPAGLLDV